jgi:macrodomain Ter protein organizer (MatP/YcbG family)
MLQTMIILPVKGFLKLIRLEQTIQQYGMKRKKNFKELRIAMTVKKQSMHLSYIIFSRLALYQMVN